ncbi:type II 3-dehydroquinate dehydratase [Peptococcus simiae]|uniref:type II 3-dehydroquinate dehydratase n=1 Tax=Peptococcus simiae TaxID=1643805 RepID=UPI00397EB560
MQILVLNGPNLNLLGLREPALYGQTSYPALCDQLQTAARAAGVDLTIRQSNHEGQLVDWIGQAYGQVDGIIFNPAAYTHTSVALLDALKAVAIPTVEVHITDPDTREPFRRISYIRPACCHTIKGRGIQGYIDALHWLIHYLKTQLA